MACECVRVSFTYEGQNYSYNLQQDGELNGKPLFTNGVSGDGLVMVGYDPDNPFDGDAGWLFRTGDHFSGWYVLSEAECPPTNGWLYDGTDVEGSPITNFNLSLCTGLYKLTPCSTIGTAYYTDQDLSDYVGRVVTIVGKDICYTVSETDEEEPTTTVTVSECFIDCTDCNEILFRLTSCFGPEKIIYSSDRRLVDSTVVKIPHLDNACFSVKRVPNYRGVLVEQYTDFSYVYTHCVDCLEQEHATPNYDTCGCSAEKVEDIQCSFVELMYQKMMSRRLGIEYCCPKDEIETTIKFNQLENELRCVDTPELPEPEVEVCCLNTAVKCPTISCNECNEPAPTMEDNCCKCESSGEASPHDCHTYTVTVTIQQLAQAVNNLDNTLNRKVFFGYFPCKKEEVTTVAITEESQKDYCVLGIPVLGYFRNNNFVAIELIRGEICEPQTPNCNEC